MNDHNWVKFDGAPVGGMTPTRVFVRSDPPGITTMTAQQQGFVRARYREFCNSVNVSAHRDGFHSAEKFAPDGTRVVMTSVSNVHRIEVRVPPPTHVPPIPQKSFYWGWVVAPTAQNLFDGINPRRPFVMDGGLRRLRFLSNDFLPPCSDLTVVGEDYYYTVEEITDSTSGNTVNSVAGPIELRSGAHTITKKIFRNTRVFATGTDERRFSWEVVLDSGGGPSGYFLQYSFQTYSGATIFYTDGYSRTLFIHEENSHETSVTGRPSGGTTFLSSGYSSHTSVFDVDGKKIGESSALDPRAIKTVPPWYTPNVSNLQDGLRKGFFFMPLHTPLQTAREVWANFYEWRQDEVRTSWGRGTDSAGGVRDCVFRPSELGAGNYTINRNIGLGVTSNDASRAWGVIPAYTQTLHGWRTSTSSPRHLAITSMEPSPAITTSTIEAMLLAANEDPALAGRTVIAGLNMAYIDKREPPRFTP